MIKVIELTSQKMGDAEFVLRLMKRLNVSVDELVLVDRLINQPCNCSDCKNKRKQPNSSLPTPEELNKAFQELGKFFGEKLRKNRHEL